MTGSVGSQFSRIRSIRPSELLDNIGSLQKQGFPSPVKKELDVRSRSGFCQDSRPKPASPRLQPNLTSYVHHSKITSGNYLLGIFSARQRTAVRNDLDSHVRRESVAGVLAERYSSVLHFLPRRRDHKIGQRRFKDQSAGAFCLPSNRRCAICDGSYIPRDGNVSTAWSVVAGRHETQGIFKLDVFCFTSCSHRMARSFFRDLADHLVRCPTHQSGIVY